MALPEGWIKLPCTIDCCEKGSGSGSGSGGPFYGKCCNYGDKRTVTVGNLHVDCSFNADCPFSGLENGESYELTLCEYIYTEPGPGGLNPPETCNSVFILSDASMSLCDVVFLYESDLEKICIGCDPPPEGPCVGEWKFIGSKDCGEGTGNVDIYLAMRLSLEQQVQGGTVNLTGSLGIWSVQVFSDFTPPVLVFRQLCWGTGLELTLPCGGPPPNSCITIPAADTLEVPDECLPLIFACGTELLVPCCNADHPDPEPPPPGPYGEPVTFTVT